MNHDQNEPLTDLVEVPRDGEDTVVSVTVVEGLEERRAHVERAVSATGAQVDNGSRLTVTVLVVGDFDLLATLAFLVLGLVHGYHKLRVRVRASA